MIPPVPTRPAAGPKRMNWPKSVSRPETNSSTTAAIWPIAYSSAEMGTKVGPRSAAGRENAGPMNGRSIAPSAYGPISRPAPSSPSTAGCFRPRSASSPPSLAAKRTSDS